jgi:hypothetical protein
MGKSDQAFFAPSGTIFPCEASKLNENFFSEFYAHEDFTAEARLYAESARDVLCGQGVFYYFAGVFAVEAVTLILILVVGGEVFRSPRAHCAMFIVTAALWSIWPNILAFRYHKGDPSDYYVCWVPYTVLTTAVFSVWHSLIVFMLYLSHRARVELLPIRSQEFISNKSETDGISSHPDVRFEVGEKSSGDSKRRTRAGPVQTNNFMQPANGGSFPQNRPVAQSAAPAATGPRPPLQQNPQSSDMQLMHQPDPYGGFEEPDV